jgi:carbon storage regulator CsrA
MALVISRKFGEKLRIGKDIYVWVHRTGCAGKVRVCIDAPRSVQIDRDEITAKPDYNQPKAQSAEGAA